MSGVKTIQESTHGHRSRAKVLSAIIGASAVATMGALALTVSGEHAESGTAASSPGMTLGETATRTASPSAPETSIATPPVKATPPDGYGTS
jgi:hypothetical protein